MQYSENYQHQLEDLICNALKEDIGDGDHCTLSIMDKDTPGKAVLKIKDEGILAGMDVSEKIFSFVEPGAVFKKIKNVSQQ